MDKAGKMQDAPLAGEAGGINGWGWTGRRGPFMLENQKQGNPLYRKFHFPFPQPPKKKTGLPYQKATRLSERRPVAFRPSVLLVWLYLYLFTLYHFKKNKVKGEGFYCSNLEQTP